MVLNWLLIILYLSEEAKPSAPAESDVAKCETCIKVLDSFKKEAETAIRDKNIDEFNRITKNFCKKYASGSPFEKFCYNVGGTDNSPASIMTEIMEKSFLPSVKQCLELQRKYGQICTDKVKIEIDWDNLNKYKIKDLKKLLQQENDECKGCMEKSEFIKQLLTHRPQEEL